MRLILGDNLRKPSIRDIILIGSFQGPCTFGGVLNDLKNNRRLLKAVGRNNYSKIQYQVKYGGKFGDRLIKFGKSFYSNVVRPGFNNVVKPVYNVTKKLVDIAANNDLANNTIKIVGNAVGTALGAPGVGNIIANAAKAADSGIKIGESVVNRLVKDKKLDLQDIKQIIDIVKEQYKEMKGKDKETIDKKVENLKENLKDVDLEKENLTKEDVKAGFKAGLIFYNPVSRKVINKYSGRVKMCGGVDNQINQNLLRILPKLLRKHKERANELVNKTIKSKESGRVKMSGSINKSDLNDISSKLEALKSKYK